MCILGVDRYDTNLIPCMDTMNSTQNKEQQRFTDYLNNDKGDTTMEKCMFCGKENTKGHDCIVLNPDEDAFWKEYSVSSNLWHDEKEINHE